VCIKVLISTVL